MSEKSYGDKLNEKQIKREIKLCFPQAIENGCKVQFLRSFEKRMLCYPLQQTKFFIEEPKFLKKAHNDIIRKRRVLSLNQWEIWLKILIEQRSDLPNNEQRIQALKLIKEFREKSSLW